MNNILELLKQRRIWIVIIGVIAFTASYFGHTIDIDQNTLADLIVKFVSNLSDLIMAGLALWSFVKPKSN